MLENDSVIEPEEVKIKQSRSNPRRSSPKKNKSKKGVGFAPIRESSRDQNSNRFEKRESSSPMKLDK